MRLAAKELKLESTVEAINAIHFEARLPTLHRLLLRVLGINPIEHFNTKISPRLREIARLL
jgi:hypothetical protein